MNVVHMNGLTLIPGIDYTFGEAMISFKQAPPMGADIRITEVVNAETGVTHITQLTGNGTTFLFKVEPNFSDRVHLYQMLEQAIVYKDNPTVRDALNKLQVVLELVKQDTQDDSVY